MTKYLVPKHRALRDLAQTLARKSTMLRPPMFSSRLSSRLSSRPSSCLSSLSPHSLPTASLLLCRSHHRGVI